MAITLEHSEVTRFFLAAISLLFAAHLFGYFFQRVGLPKVIGEIAGGLVLGPTVLGQLFPEFDRFVFLEIGGLLAVLYWFGLILLMFCSGFEMQARFSAAERRSVIWITVASTILPLTAGWFASDWFPLEELLGPQKNLVSLKLIVAISIAVTSIPVISKIFFDLKIIDTRFAKIVLGTATVHDIILWVLLAVATGLVSTTTRPEGTIVLHVLVTLGFFGGALFVAPKIIKAKKRMKGIRLIPRDYEAGFVMLTLLAFVELTSALDVNLVFGALLAGVVISYLKNERFDAVKTNVKEFSFAFFIPIYFAIVGLKLDLVRNFDVGFFFLFLLLAICVQFVSVLVAARLLGHPWLGAANLAVAMNARGGPGIVLASIAFEAGIISETFFVTLVLVAIVTSLIAGAWLRYVLDRGWDLLPGGSAG